MLRTYSLSSEQVNRLKKGIRVSLSIPLIDSLEDFIWESLFTYAKGIPLVDPLFALRKKLLFDVVDIQNRVGWSAKSLQWNIKQDCEFELVIQRADIFKKHAELGFEKLDRETEPQILGAALLKHWQKKVWNDAKEQGVEDFRVCVLLKSKDNSKYAYFEEELCLYSAEDIEWRWTSSAKNGLKGIRKIDGFVVYRWYPNQKQLFERFRLYPGALIFNLQIERMKMSDLIERLA